MNKNPRSHTRNKTMSPAAPAPYSSHRHGNDAHDVSGDDIVRPNGGHHHLLLLFSTNLPLLASVTLAALTTGATSYAFSFYSSQLKSSLRLSQSQLDTLSGAPFFAGCLSWIPGKYVVDRYGGRAGIVAGGLGNAMLLTCYWLVVRWGEREIQDIIMTSSADSSSEKDSILLRDMTARFMLPLSLLGFLTFLGCASITGSVFKVIVENCGTGSKGRAVGCAKGYVGVGSGVYVCLFGALFGRASTNPSSTTQDSVNTLDFLLMAACLSILAAVLPAILLLPRRGRSPPRDGTRGSHFRVLYIGLILLGMLMVGTSLKELNETKFKDGNAPPLSGTDDNSIAPGEGAFSVLLIHGTQKWMRRLSSSTTTDPHWARALFILLLWWGPPLSLLIIPPKKEEESSSGGYETLHQEEEVCDEDIVSSVEQGGSGLNGEDEPDLVINDASSTDPRPLSFAKKDGAEQSRKEFTLVEMLHTGCAWLMAWTFVILVGGGTLMTCNIGQMTEALGFHSNLTPASLALFSVAQGASRVITGSVSESALTWNVPKFCGCLSSSRGLPRPAFLLLASLVSAVAHLTLAVASTEDGFAFGVTLSGVAFGMAWPLMVLITGEVFGTLHVGANYMFFDGFSSAMGTLLLSKFVAQTVYNQHIIESQGDSVDGGSNEYQCYGKECFRMSHIIVCLLSFSCVATSFGVIHATKDVYRR